MEIAQDIQNEAISVLKFEPGTKFPSPLLGTDFYLTTVDDGSIITHSVVKHNGIEYKIGPKRK